MRRILRAAGSIAVILAASQAVSATYSIVEQDTHSITLIDIDTLTEPSPTIRKFHEIIIQAWPELWQDSYDQIGETDDTVDCWNHKIMKGPDTLKLITGEEIGVGVDTAPEWRELSDGYGAFEDMVCHHISRVAVPPFKTLKAVEKYYFDWLNRTVPTITK